MRASAGISGTFAEAAPAAKQQVALNQASKQQEAKEEEARKQAAKEKAAAALKAMRASTGPQGYSE
jgi:hypothetical protein